MASGPVGSPGDALSVSTTGYRRGATCIGLPTGPQPARWSSVVTAMPGDPKPLLRQSLVPFPFDITPNGYVILPVFYSPNPAQKNRGVAGTIYWEFFFHLPQRCPRWGSIVVGAQFYVIPGTNRQRGGRRTSALYSHFSSTRLFLSPMFVVKRGRGIRSSALA